MDFVVTKKTLPLLKEEEKIKHIDFNLLMEALKIKNATAPPGPTNIKSSKELDQLHKEKKNENFYVEVSSLLEAVNNFK
jgi:hypothetical protein